MPSNEVAKQGEGDFMVTRFEPAELQANLRDNLGGEALSAFDLDRVKVPAGGATSWEVPTLQGEESIKDLEGIIVYMASRRAYWHEKYEGGNEQPDCSSDDGLIGVGDPGGECAACPFAQWQSADDGVGQKCKAMRQLFLLRRDSLIPIVVTLPPASLGNAKKFFIRLVQANQHYTSIVSVLSLEKAQSKAGGITYSRVTFKAADTLPEDEAAKVRAYADELKPALDRTRVNREEVDE